MAVSATTAGRGGHAAAFLSARVADERLLLAAEQHQYGAETREDEPGRRREHRQRHRIPQPFRDVALDRRLQQLEAGRMDRIPGIAELGDIEPVAGDRLGAVIDDKNETRGENPQAEGTQEKADHGGYVAWTKV